jgi:predicted DNA-binding protein
MAFDSGTNVRLDGDLKARLQRVADAAGIKPASLIRMAVEEYCSQVERTGSITIHIQETGRSGGDNNFSSGANAPTAPVKYSTRRGAKPKPKK